MEDCVDVTRRNLIEFTDTEQAHEDENEDTEVMGPPMKTRGAIRKAASKSTMNMELESKRLDMERDRMKYEHELRLKQMEIELARINVVEHRNDNKEPDVPVKLKLQPYDHKSKDDILTYLSDFEAIAKQAKWTNEVKVLQLRTLLTGEAKEVSQLANKNYEELRKALVDRFGRRPHQYFADLLEVKRGENETYRGLMAKIHHSVNRFVGDEDPKVRLCEEFFLKALSPAQAQWIRRNKGSNSVVDAAEDYILPTISPKGSSSRENVRLHNNVDSRKCYNCDRIGHIAKNCRAPKCRIKDKKPNAATYFVKPSYGEKLINVCGQVNGCELLFVKDTGAEMTLIREEYVDSNNIIEGQRITLYTAVGQPFTAKMAVVNLDTPYFKGHATVGLVANLAADALLGMLSS